MLIRDSFRQHFYDVIKKDHVLVLTNGDVDALCATRILTHLFACDDVAYSLVVIDGWDSLGRALEEYAKQIHTAVLINCGSNRALTNFDFASNMTLYVVDSRRPYDLDNVYADENVRILANGIELDELKCPEAKELFESSEDDEEEGDGKRSLEDIERRAVKRARRQQWCTRRNDLLWDYYENSWYSISSAVLMLEIAHLLGKSSAEAMWCAVVGLNSQLVDHLITLEAYTAVCIDRLRPFIRRYSPKNISAMKGDDVLRISFDKELPLAMYAHWSLYKSMITDEHFVCRTQFWQQRGEARMRSLLSTLGLTLTECKQMYSALSYERKREVSDILQKEFNSSFASFTAVVGYCNKFNACDFARALCARLEVGLTGDESLHERFSASMHILRKFLGGVHGDGDLISLTKAIELYKSCLESTVAQVFMVVNQSIILSTGPFFLLSLPQSEEVKLLSSRHFLFAFASFVLKAFCMTSRLKSRSSRPLIVAIPMSGDYAGWFKVTGVMPFGTEYADSNHKSFIGRAFERVVEHTTARSVRRDSFDSTVILLKAEEKSRFFEGLQAIMEIA
uniref:Cell division control protein 45 n=1 Tax=Parascaris univalens TaxID=6257 RepID=A0A915BIJ7_PARUN